MGDRGGERVQEGALGAKLGVKGLSPAHAAHRGGVPAGGAAAVPPRRPSPEGTCCDSCLLPLGLDLSGCFPSWALLGEGRQVPRGGGGGGWGLEAREHLRAARPPGPAHSQAAWQQASDEGLRARAHPRGPHQSRANTRAFLPPRRGVGGRVGSKRLALGRPAARRRHRPGEALRFIGTALRGGRRSAAGAARGAEVARQLGCQWWPAQFRLVPHLCAPQGGGTCGATACCWDRARSASGTGSLVTA